MPNIHINNQRCTVADELEYDALPIEIKELAEKVLGKREDLFNQGYEYGYSVGYDHARDELRRQE